MTELNFMAYVKVSDRLMHYLEDLPKDDLVRLNYECFREMYTKTFHNYDPEYLGLLSVVFSNAEAVFDYDKGKRLSMEERENLEWLKDVPNRAFVVGWGLDYHNVSEEPITMEVYYTAGHDGGVDFWKEVIEKCKEVEAVKVMVSPDFPEDAEELEVKIGEALLELGSYADMVSKPSGETRKDRMKRIILNGLNEIGLWDKDGFIESIVDKLDAYIEWEASGGDYRDASEDGSEDNKNPDLEAIADSFVSLMDACGVKLERWCANELVNCFNCSESVDVNLFAKVVKDVAGNPDWIQEGVAYDGEYFNYFYDDIPFSGVNCGEDEENLCCVVDMVNYLLDRIDAGVTKSFVEENGLKAYCC